MHSLVVHCEKSAYNIYIGRGKGSIFGNPFTHLTDSKLASVIVADRRAAVQAYRDWLAGAAWQDVEPERRQKILAAIPTLKGQILGCWCAPKECHGEVLAELANAETSPQIVPPKCEPGNIYSGLRSARTVLTNPTELAKKKGNLKHSYPVTINGRVYVDAEAAYQHLKWRTSGSWEDRFCLCVEIIEAKLRQYPVLVQFIKVNGGAGWLEKCSHHVGAKTGGFQEWEGNGRDSGFIRALIAAYERL